MLRILVISLFVANLFLLGFQGSKPDVVPETVAPKMVGGDPRIPTIHLFSEMIEDQGLLNGNRQCYSIGPFHTEEDRDAVRTDLLAVSSGVAERETQALVENGYWVFMPPYISMLEANEELLSLKALGLTDIGIIYDGAWSKAISLGYFLRQGNAQKRKKDLENRGYQPQIRVQRQSEPRYWLDYEQPPGSDLFSLSMQDRRNDFMRRPLPCPDEPMFDVNEDSGSVPFDTPVASESVAENITARPEEINEDNQATEPEALSEDVQQEPGGETTLEDATSPEEGVPEEADEAPPGQSDPSEPVDEDGVPDDPEIDQV